MKNSAKAKPVKAKVKAKAEAPAKIALGTLAFGHLTPICNGTASLVINSTTIDGRYEGWLCRPDGSPLEKVRASSVDEIEARAKALLAKGSL